MDAALAIALLTFASVALALYGAAGLLVRRRAVRRRYDALVPDVVSSRSIERDRLLTLDSSRFGLTEEARRAMRQELVRAGYFDPAAVVVFTLFRLGLLILLPVLGALAAPLLLPASGLLEVAAVALLLLAVARTLPSAYLSRRQRGMEAAYRAVFPDFLDMLVVCINAGLSLEAALERATREFDRNAPAFRANFELMGSEMRAGKSTSEALRTCAERLGLPEARSFAGLMQQTIELGTDIAQTLATFSDEMRDKRMSRAEERAAALPPKLTLPLGLFIFPVVLIVILAPAVLKVVRATAG